MQLRAKIIGRMSLLYFGELRKSTEHAVILSGFAGKVASGLNVGA